jgi:hypothetical protein
MEKITVYYQWDASYLGTPLHQTPTAFRSSGV